MTQNLIDLQLPDDALTAIDEALNTLETRLAGLVALTPDQRRQLTKMGDKSEAFCRQAVHVMGENPGILPRNFDLDGLRRDLAALDALRPRAIRLARLHERLQARQRHGPGQRPDDQRAGGLRVLEDRRQGRGFGRAAADVVGAVQSRAKPFSSHTHFAIGVKRLAIEKPCLRSGLSFAD